MREISSWINRVAENCFESEEMLFLHLEPPHPISFFRAFRVIRGRFIAASALKELQPFMKHLFTIFIVFFAVSGTAIAQDDETPTFRSVVEKKLRDEYRTELSKVCPIDTDPVAARVFSDYGAIFVSNNGGKIPRSCILDSEARVQAFQGGMNPDVVTDGGVQVTLQKPAMAAFLAARREAATKGLSITPRGGAAASTRSYARTFDLWGTRFYPGLRYWTGKGRIKSAEAAEARNAPIGTQVAMVLAWEEKGIYFSKDLSKSILYSVAVPGASQHIFMLALDVEQFANRQVREILARHGWFQTVKSDLPHFTFLGEPEADLPELGLTDVTVSGQKFWIPKM